MTYQEAVTEAKDNHNAVYRTSWIDSYMVYVPERTTAVTWVPYIKDYLGNLPITFGEGFLRTRVVSSEKTLFECYIPSDDDHNATDWEVVANKCSNKVPDMSIPIAVNLC